MKTVLQYRFDHQRRLIHETLRGEIRFDDFINHEKAKINDPEHDDSYSVLADIRESIFLISDEEKKQVYKIFRDIESKINMNRKCAILTNNPSEVVNSEIFKLRMKQFSPMMFMVFTTEEAAYRWLDK